MLIDGSYSLNLRMIRQSVIKAASEYNYIRALFGFSGWLTGFGGKVSQCSVANQEILIPLFQPRARISSMPVLPVRFIKLSQDRKSKVNLILMMIDCFFAERSKFFIYDNWQILYFFSTTQANKGTAYQSTNFFMHWLQIIVTNRNDSFKEST